MAAPVALRAVDPAVQVGQLLLRDQVTPLLLQAEGAGILQVGIVAMVRRAVAGQAQVVQQI